MIFTFIAALVATFVELFVGRHGNFSAAIFHSLAPISFVISSGYTRIAPSIICAILHTIPIELNLAEQ
jgi:hypothetical protein